MRMRRATAATLLFIGLSVGCHRTAAQRCPTLPVPDDAADARSPSYTLPLSQTDADDLTNRLQYDLSERKMKADVAARPDAKKEYGGRLQLLMAPITRSNLKSGKLKAWLSQPTIEKVTDSRPGEQQNSVNAVTANDGAFFWIFYPEGNRLTKVMAVKVSACQNMKEAAH